MEKVDVLLELADICKQKFRLYKESLDSSTHLDFDSLKTEELFISFLGVGEAGDHILSDYVTGYISKERLQKDLLLMIALN